MTKRTIVLPLVDNAGQSLSTEIEAIEAEILATAGGYSVSATSGVWRGNDGHTYRDQSNTYTVVSDAAADRTLQSRLSTWAAWLRQQALYSDTADVAVEFAAPAVPVAA